MHCVLVALINSTLFFQKLKKEQNSYYGGQILQEVAWRRARPSNLQRKKKIFDL